MFMAIDFFDKFIEFLVIIWQGAAYPLINQFDEIIGKKAAGGPNDSE